LLTAPKNPTTVNDGLVMNSWFDIPALKEDIKTNTTERGLNELEETTKRIRKVLNEEIKVLGGDSTKVFLGGISQGCATALHVGLGFDKPLGGILGGIGYLLDNTEEHEANKNTPIFLYNGKNDPLIPFDKATKSFERLNRETHPITQLSEEKLVHTLSEGLLDAMRKWLIDILEKNNKSLL